MPQVVRVLPREGNDSVRPHVPYINLGVAIEALSYGIHIVLFAFCMRVLLRRRVKNGLQLAMIAATSAMFIFSTIDVGYTWHLGFKYADMYYEGGLNQLLKLIVLKLVLIHLNGAISSALVITRCYVVWGRWLPILYIGGPLWVGKTAVGLYFCMTQVSANSSRGIDVMMTFNVVFQVIVTTLTAIRIYWVARQLKIFLGRQLLSQYHVAVGIIVESGLLISATGIAGIILSRGKFVWIGNAITAGATSTLSTLLIVRVAMGQSVQDLETMRMTTMKNQDTFPPSAQSNMNQNPQQLDDRDLESRSTDP